MHIKILSSLSFLAIWLCLVGISTEPLAVVFAMVVPLITFLVSVKFNLLPGQSVFSIRILPYVIWLLKEVLMSAINVIKIAWRPHLKIIPVIEPIKSIQKCEEGLVLYANSITLTPGTVTLNAIDNALLVHALDVSIMEELKEGIMDRKIAEVIATSRDSQDEHNNDSNNERDKES